jgi:uncharacterized membrane protein
MLATFAVALAQVLPAMAQEQAPRGSYWPGPWFMGDGWSFWWICPLMMVAMMLVMMFACRFMCSWHRD